ncbi:MAG: type II toxin-antitoxin system RelE/ParE family toxin [Algisphaera sp.]
MNSVTRSPTTQTVGKRFETDNHELTARGIRRLPIKGYGYLLYYRHDEATVYILSLVHGSQDQPTIEKKLDQ